MWVRRTVIGLGALFAALVCAALVIGHFASFSRSGWSNVHVARSTVNSLGVAATIHLAQRGSAYCPTVHDLLADGVLGQSVSATDPWGQPYGIDCDDFGPIVISAGRDELFGTEDDISNAATD